MTDQSTHATRVATLFDSKSATWQAKYAPGGQLTPRLAHMSAEVASRVPPGGRVLDLGCGTGELVRCLARARAQVVGCDISSQMLARAAAADPGQGTGLVRLSEDWQRLPLRDGSFDCVVAASVLEYTADPARVLRECARVLRPGGWVLCTVPDTRHPVRWLEECARRAAGRLGLGIGRHWPRYAGYLAYLRTSRQRHSYRWWVAAAACAGLGPVPHAGGQGLVGGQALRRASRGLPALRLLVLAKPDGRTGAQP